MTEVRVADNCEALTKGQARTSQIVFLQNKPNFAARESTKPPHSLAICPSRSSNRNAWGTLSRRIWGTFCLSSCPLRPQGKDHERSFTRCHRRSRHGKVPQS